MYTKQADDEESVESNPIEELKSSYSLNEDEAGIVAEIIDELGLEASDLDKVETGEGMSGRGIRIESGNKEWICFKTESNARDEAEKYNKDLIDEIGVEGINGWEDYIDERKAEHFFRQVYSEWNESYVTDIKSEGNRLAEEMEQWGAEDEDQLAEMLTDNQIDEGMGGLSHYRSNFGAEDANKLVLKEHLVDIDALIKYIIDTDGIAHSLASYDGEEIGTKHGYLAYRQN